MSERRRVTYTQLEILCDSLNEHRELATGYNKSSRAREASRRMWQNIAESLNGQGDGAIKDWKGWSKYWNDYKSKLKKTVATIRASLQRTGGGPSDIVGLSEIENKFLDILGESFGTGLPGIRVEPFNHASEALEIIMENETSSPNLFGSTLGNTSTDVAQGSSTDLSLTGPPRVGSQAGPSRVVAQAALSRAVSQAGPSRAFSQAGPSRAQNSPATIQPTISPTSPQQEELQGSVSQTLQARRQRPRLLGQRQRTRRREPPMSQETARRTLIDISNQRSQHDATRNDIMKDILQEIKNTILLIPTS